MHRKVLSTGSVSKKAACISGELVRSLGWEYPLEMEMLDLASVIVWRILWTVNQLHFSPYSHQESEMTKSLTLSLSPQNRNNQSLEKLKKYTRLCFQNQYFSPDVYISCDILYPRSIPRLKFMSIHSLVLVSYSLRILFSTKITTEYIGLVQLRIARI